jgi:hypothetical protein
VEAQSRKTPRREGTAARGYFKGTDTQLTKYWWDCLEMPNLYTRDKIQLAELALELALES